MWRVSFPRSARKYIVLVRVRGRAILRHSAGRRAPCAGIARPSSSFMSMDRFRPVAPGTLIVLLVIAVVLLALHSTSVSSAEPPWQRPNGGCPPDTLPDPYWPNCRIVNQRPSSPRPSSPTPRSDPRGSARLCVIAQRLSALPGAVQYPRLRPVLAAASNVCGFSWPPSRSTPRPISGGGNLAVEVLAQRIDPVTGDHAPVDRFLITAATLECVDTTCARGERCIGPRWLRKGWCGVQPTNLPARTDASGSATLYFRVDPPPAQVGLRQPASKTDILAAPSVHVRLPNGGFAGHLPTLLSPDRWRITVEMPRGY